MSVAIAIIFAGVFATTTLTAFGVSKAVRHYRGRDASKEPNIIPRHASIITATESQEPKKEETSAPVTLYAVGLPDYRPIKPIYPITNSALPNIIRYY